MTEELLDLVSAELLPTLIPLGFSVTESETADSFDNATVVLAGPDLRIRIVRERSQISVGFASVSEPNTWFDSDIITEYLDLSATSGLLDRNARHVLQGAGAFVASFGHELGTKFDRLQFPATKRQLKDLQEARATKLFGPISCGR